MQVVRQAFGPHTYRPQLVDVRAQVPAPSQVPAGVNVLPRQVAVSQLVLVGAYWQAPAPSHRPVSPQGGAAAQRPPVSMSPAGIGWQEPALPATAQERHVPQLAAPQQTPSTQWALSHSASPPHCWPSRLSPQAPPVQTFGGAQSLFVAQAARQVVPLQA